jgi:hypothetical protein
VNRADESRPIYYPRLAHVGAGGQSAAADQLLDELLDLQTAMSYQEAAVVADRLVEMTPRQPQAHYNRACVMGRLRRSDEALASLELAIDFGWRDLVHLSLDPDLDSIRDTARYTELTRTLRRLVAQDAQERISDNVPRKAPTTLQGLGVPAATIALVDNGRVSWMTSIGADSAAPTSPGWDEPVEVSPVVRLFALLALMTEQGRDTGTLGDPASGHGAVLRRAGTGLTGPRIVSPPELIEAVEAATGQPFPSYCRAHILEPLRMTRTRFAGPAGAPDPRVYTTAGDLGRLLAAFCPPPAPGTSLLVDRASTDRLIAAGERFGLQTTGNPGSTAMSLELAHRSADTAAVIRWYPRRGQGLVVVTRDRDGIPAAQRVARLLFGQ